MDKIDARKLPWDALKTLRGQAIRLRQELGLPWHEIARVMGLKHHHRVWLGAALRG
jgi:hypothetical protein